MAGHPLHLAYDEASRKRFFALHLNDFDEWPPTLGDLIPPFGVFLAWDADETPCDVISQATQRILASGAAYIVIWGAGSERVHDIVDEAHVQMTLDQLDQPVVITTWHTDETLNVALWYFVDVASLDAPQMEADSHWLAVSVGCLDWSASIRESLTDLTAFRATMDSRHRA